jgi:REP element-mobilizing transposase RayT
MKVRSSGNVTDELIKAYIENQSHNEDNFQITA